MAMHPPRCGSRSLRRLLSVASLVAFVGCASSGSGDPEGPLEIRGIDVRPAMPGAILEVLANGPLAWTAVTTLEGHLLLELDNAVAVPSLGKLEFGDGLIEAIEVELIEGIEPRTRLTVRTRTRIDFAPKIVGDSFQMRLLPIGEQDEGAIADEPLYVDEFGLADTPPTGPSFPTGVETPPVETEESEAPPVLRQGTPASPLVGPPVSGPAATRLLGVRIVEEGVVELLADGDVVHRTFWLEGPTRFVVDLPGLYRGEVPEESTGTSGPVLRARTGQFSSDPDPVTRVVLDLVPSAQLRLETIPHGLLIHVSVAEEVSP